ncbi:MAG: hypothetical protein U0Q21_00985 [Dermatophilaceae bacterium]
MTDTLHARAEGIRPSGDLAERALAAGRRRRSRRRAIAVVATGAVAVAVAVGSTTMRQHSPQGPAAPPHPSTGSAPTTTASESLPMASRTPLDDLDGSWNDELPVGAAIDVTPRLELGIDGRVALVMGGGRAPLGDDAGMTYRILDPDPAHTLVVRVRVTTAPTPSDWTLLDVAGDGSVTEVANGAAPGTTIEAGLITGAAIDPSGSGDYAISTSVDPNIPTADGPDHLYIVRPGQHPSVRYSMRDHRGQVLGWTSRGVLVDADTGVWLWDPTGTGLAKVYRTSDPLARVVPSKPNLVLGHRELDYSPQEETVEPGGCLDLIDVDTLAVREVTCGDDSTRASRTPYPTAVSPDGAIVMASMPMTLDGDRIDRQGEPATSMAYFGVFPQQRFSDGDHLIKPVGNPPGWWQWWVRCAVRAAACEQAPLPRGIRAISLY